MHSSVMPWQRRLSTSSSASLTRNSPKRYFLAENGYSAQKRILSLRSNGQKSRLETGKSDSALVCDDIGYLL